MSRTLRHATKHSNLDSIVRDGLLAKHYGAVHGKMEYAPAGPSVYLSRHKHSNNLNTALFDGGDPVVVLEIDAAALDQDLIYPDECLFAMIDEEFLPDPDEAPEGEGFEGAVEEFAEHFGMSKKKARAILAACAGASSEAEYPTITKSMWKEYLKAEGEIAYLGDIPPTAIKGWHLHPDSPALPGARDGTGPAPRRGRIHRSQCARRSAGQRSC